MARIAARIEASGERFWRHEDFADLPLAAVNQALSRLARRGTIQRVHKGLYYRPRATVLGPSKVAESDLTRRILKHVTHPTGATAANLLGLTTQNPARAEYATVAPEPPRHLRGIRLVGRRPVSRKSLGRTEGAILEVLRARAVDSELSPEETVRRLLAVLRQEDTFARLVAASFDEPPRVRAMLGALGQEMGASPELLRRLRESLNRLSRFNFGPLKALRHAKEWQAK